MTRETLDEMLDRVAADMTTIAPDATFVARLRPRLDRSERPGIGLDTIGAAAFVLALVVAAALVRSPDSETHALATVPRSQSDHPLAPAFATWGGERPASAASAGALTVTRRASDAVTRASVIAHTAVASTVPALSAPADLGVAHLELDPLVVHPVDVPDLEIAGLAVTELGVPEDPKE